MFRQRSLHQGESLTSFFPGPGSFENCHLSDFDFSQELKTNYGFGCGKREMEKVFPGFTDHGSELHPGHHHSVRTFLTTDERKVSLPQEQHFRRKPFSNDESDLKRERIRIRKQAKAEDERRNFCIHSKRPDYLLASNTYKANPCSYSPKLLSNGETTFEGNPKQKLFNEIGDEKLNLKVESFLPTSTSYHRAKQDEIKTFNLSDVREELQQLLRHDTKKSKRKCLVHKQIGSCVGFTEPNAVVRNLSKKSFNLRIAQPLPTLPPKKSNHVIENLFANRPKDIFKM
eukprot:snap_masked-scaffold_2-processed-gene-12.36-mRNA-1 protein AED:1.00 eAED:1.00 QI:0/0/0/0/1/1/3/0/285